MTSCPVETQKFASLPGSLSLGVLPPDTQGFAGEPERDARLSDDIVQHSWVGLLDRQLHHKVVQGLGTGADHIIPAGIGLLTT